MTKMERGMGPDLALEGGLDWNKTLLKFGLFGK